MEEKTCFNCKYTSASIFEEPCMSCKQKSNWASDNFKSGDLVVAKKDHISEKNIYIYLVDNWVLRVPRYVFVRSECDCAFSDYTNELISADIAFHTCDLEYASHEDIAEHDNRANKLYITETLNEWFSKLIREELKKKANRLCNELTIKDPGFKDYGKGVDYNKGTAKLNSVRYDKFPTLNGNFIKKVIFSDPATIVFWEDGTKTVVKTQDGEVYDKEKGLVMAISKRVFGNERDYYNVFKRWMRKGKERHEQR